MPKGITDSQLKQYLADWKQLHHRYEQQYYKVFKKALDEQIKPVITEVKLRGISNLQNILPLLISREPLQNAYKQCYVKVGVSHAQWTKRQIQALIKANKKESPFAFFSRRWKELMERFYESESSKRIVDVTDTTIRKVQQSLSNAREQDLSLSQQADYLVDQLQSDDFNRSRALRISRTESTAGANKGASLAAADNDYQTNKRWLSVLDEVTRHTHILADGQTVDINEKFIVGGHECNHPGDLSLPAEEVISCRCTTIYVPVFDSDGLPVLK